MEQWSLKTPGAIGSEICFALDENGVQPTKQIKNRSYEETYDRDRKQAKQLDSRFAKIRKKMRSQGLIY
jgi:hypothetical protein